MHCWRMASYLHMAKLIVRNALLVVAVGRPRIAPPRLRQRNAVHGRHSTFLHQLAARCAAAAALTWRRAPRACARAARSACASRSWTHAAVIAPRQPARGRPRRARAAPSLLRALCHPRCRPGPRAAVARPVAVCVRRLPPRAEVRATPRTQPLTAHAHVLTVCCVCACAQAGTRPLLCRRPRRRRLCPPAPPPRRRAAAPPRRRSPQRPPPRRPRRRVRRHIARVPSLCDAPPLPSVARARTREKQKACARVS